MNWNTDFIIKEMDKKINYGSSIILLGSCFTENFSDIFFRLKFKCLPNPFGIIYNPLSLAGELNCFMNKKKFTESEIFEESGLFKSFQFHGKTAHTNKKEMLALMHDAVSAGNKFLKKATHLFITFGTSQVYILKKSGEVVANNHKQPAAMFFRKQLKADEIIAEWENLISALYIFNPALKIIFTVSPVRHFKDGAEANALSKATLLYCVHQLMEKYNSIYYFPAYEIMMDDLRDYRFYENDLLHPNKIAIDYIWEKIKMSCIDSKIFSTMQAIEEIHAAKNHRPFFKETELHKKFLNNMLQKAEALQKQNREIDLGEEIKYFGG